MKTLVLFAGGILLGCFATFMGYRLGIQAIIATLAQIVRKYNIHLESKQLTEQQKPQHYDTTRND